MSSSVTALLFVAMVIPGGDLDNVAQNHWRSNETSVQNILAVISKLQKKNIPYSVICRTVANLQKPESGASLVEAATKLGMRLRITDLSQAGDRAIRTPSLAFVEPDGRNKSGQWVVVARCERDTFTILDPSWMRLSITSRSEFRRIWTGHVGVINSPTLGLPEMLIAFISGIFIEPFFLVYCVGGHDESCHRSA